MGKMNNLTPQNLDSYQDVEVLDFCDLLRQHFLILVILINSLPVNAPYMAQLVNTTFELRNRNWGWHDGLTCGLSRACRGFKTGCNDFFVFALPSIAEIPT